MSHFDHMKFSYNIQAGFGSLKNIGTEIQDMGISGRIIIVSGETAFSIAGKVIEESLCSIGYSVEPIVCNITPTFEFANTMVENIRKILDDRETFIIGVGGGSTLDICKYVCSKLNLNLIAVPTLLSSDAIATGYSVLWQSGKNKAVSTQAPFFIVGDYDVLGKQPKHYVASGVGDMLSKISALYDWRLGFWLGDEKYNDFAQNVAMSTTELLKTRIDDVAKMNYIGIETLFLSEVTDGYLMQIAGTTRVAAGSEHLFTFALENILGRGDHGIFCGIGTIMMSYLQNRGEAKVKNYLHAVGAPVSAREMDIKPADIVKALTTAHTMRPWYTILGANGICEGKAERLARYTQII